MTDRILAAIFDLDGTLLDTLADIANSANAALADLGLATYPPEAYRQFVGDGVIMLMTRAIPAGPDQEQLVTAAVTRFGHHYRQRWHEQTHLYPGIAELLDELMARSIQLAVLSNKPHAFTCEIIEHFCKRWPFRAVYGQRPNVPKKPDPAGALQIFRELNVTAAETVFVGDSHVDLNTATNSGCIPVGVAWGFRGTEELVPLKPRKILEHPRDLLNLLDAGE